MRNFNLPVEQITLQSKLQGDRENSVEQKTPATSTTDRYPSVERPFILELVDTSDGKSNSVLPVRRGIMITPALRTSGLLFALPAQELKNFIYLLSFATAYGLGRPTVQQLSHAMQVSETRVRTRMDRLTAFLRNGKHLAFPIRRTDSQDAYSLSKEIVALVEERPNVDAEAPVHPKSESKDTMDPTGPRSVREVIVEISRMKHTKPRVEVERDIARQMGWRQSGQTSAKSNSASTGTTSKSRSRLVGAGVTPRVADELLDRYSEEQINRQLEWLPYRKAKNPARLLVAAIEGDYEQPIASRKGAPRNSGSR
jgi:hypothetical protein